VRQARRCCRGSPAVGPATPAATPAARCSQARALWQYAFAALVCTPLRRIRFARAHGTLRRLYTSPRAHAGPAAPPSTAAGAIAAILDAAALWRRRCSQNCEAIVETLLDEDAAPTRFADRSSSVVGCSVPVYHWSQLRHRRTRRTRWTSSCARFRHPACKTRYFNGTTTTGSSLVH